MNKDGYEAWQKTRQKGKWRFVLLNGVLAWGVPMYLIMTFVIGDGLQSEFFIRRAWTGAIIWPAAGLCFGLALWIYNEKQYRKYLRQQENTEQ